MSQQWSYDNGRRVQVLITRRFEASRYTLGVGELNGSWYVYHRDDEEGQWQAHCGPYPDMAQAMRWITDIREGPVEQPGVAGS